MSACGSASSGDRQISRLGDSTTLFAARSSAEHGPPPEQPAARRRRRCAMRIWKTMLARPRRQAQGGRQRGTPAHYT